MRLELKNVKVAESLSEETTAYTARLYADGKPVADCSNHGQGGPDMYYPCGSGGDEVKAERARKAFDEVQTALGGFSAMEDAVGKLLSEWLEAQDIKKFAKRCLKKGFPFAVVANLANGYAEYSAYQTRAAAEAGLLSASAKSGYQSGRVLDGATLETLLSDPMNP